MKLIYLLMTTVLLVFSLQTVSIAQSSNISESFKKHFNETVQEVRNTDSPDIQRDILNESLSKMIVTVERIESLATLTQDDKASLKSYKDGLSEKLNELNGKNGFNPVMDKDILDFTDYSQNYIEQANSTITIGVTTALLILIILLLL